MGTENSQRRTRRRASDASWLRLDLRYLWAAIGLLLLTGVVGADDSVPFPGERSEWYGFARNDFEVDGKRVLVVSPKTAAPGRPWVWHGEFFGHKPAPDIALLNRGFHVVYLRVPDMLGSPGAVVHWNACYRVMTEDYGLASKVALVGLSRGGLYCYNWAVANPDKVACIYGDAPVCDFKSWPGGRGAGKGSDRDWKLVLERYGFPDDEAALAYSGNPVDRLQPLAEAAVPLLHVYGDADDVVPWDENTGVIAERYRALGGQIELIAKPGVGHHPHGLNDPTPIVEFITRHACPPVVGELPSSSKAHEVAGVQGSLASIDPDGVRVHHIVSPYQSDVTELRVLLPDQLQPGRRYPVLFVLPVEAGRGERWGDGLTEVQRADLHNRFGLICVAPTFSQLPWYADHPSDPHVRQESYLLNAILPVLRWEYPQARHDRDGRLLMGFSKSGWGAWSLLLRHPDVFGRAVAWDAPLMLDAPGKYGSGPIFGTDASFENYSLQRLITEWRSEASSQPRLIHFGYGNFRGEHQRMEQRLNELQISHAYVDGPQREHHWNSGWVVEAVELLAVPRTDAVE